MLMGPFFVEKTASELSLQAAYSAIGTMYLDAGAAGWPSVGLLIIFQFGNFLHD